jgi:dipeptidyl aminopeptidase/acylaminoacyl peptidase
VELIPREVFFASPSKIQGSISPDGAKIGFLAPVNSVLNVWVQPVGGEPQPVTSDGGRGIWSYFWASDSRRVVYLQDHDGDENRRLFSVELSSGRVRCHTPYEGAQAQVLGLPRHQKSRIAVGMNRDDPRYHDLYAVDLGSDAGPELVAKNPGFNSLIGTGWVVDDEVVARAGMRTDDDGSVVLCVPDGAGWRALFRLGPEDSLSFRPLHLTRDATGLYALDSVHTDTARLVRLDLATGDIEVLAHDPGADISAVYSRPVTREPQLVGVLRDRLSTIAIDPKVEHDLERLLAAGQGDLSMLERDDADQRWLARFVVDDGPERTYLYDRSTQVTELLFEHRAELGRYRLARKETFGFTARDGLQVAGYLSFPPGEERRGLPTVLLVHGGPWYRTVWRFDPAAQWLANRGYLCVQVNFRGSTGYGKTFLNAGDREWGGKMQDDLLDAVDWVVGHGYADPGRVGIFGASYGGYAALCGVAFTPEVFRCAVDLCGPANLKAHIEARPTYWPRQEWHRRVGDPATEPEFLWSRSPLSKVDQIRAPVLIGQGEADPRVRQAESEEIVAALRERGVLCEYLLFPGEGHLLLKPENNLRFFAAAEQFLARHLGGRCQR